MGYLFRWVRTSLRSALGGLSRLAGRLVVAGERYLFPEARYMSHFETHARWCIVVADAAGPTRRVPEQSRSTGVPIQLAGSLDSGGERRVPPRLAREALLAAPRQYWDRPPWVPRHAFRVNPCGWSGLCSTRAIERISCPKRGRYANPKGMPALRREKRASEPDQCAFEHEANSKMQF